VGGWVLNKDLDVEKGKYIRNRIKAGGRKKTMGKGDLPRRMELK